MKLVVFVLVAGSLILGLVGAASAYLAPLSLPDQALLGLTSADTISAPAAASGAPIVRKGGTVDAGVLAGLRHAGVERLRVEEFGFDRWTGRWIFVLACGGLVVGGLLGRRHSKQAAQRAAATTESAPEGHLDVADGALRELLERWSTFADGATASRATIAALSPIIEETLPAFAATRPVIVARRGLGGYAAVMDRFAAAERQVHRAWSASADGVPEESRECVSRARVLLAEARAALLHT